MGYLTLTSYKYTIAETKFSLGIDYTTSGSVHFRVTLKQDSTLKILQKIHLY